MAFGKKCCAIWLGLGLWMAFTCQAADDWTLRMQEANVSYQNGNYASAIETYASILEAGYFSAELEFNLGNAYYKTGEMASAILHFERALKLAPGDPDIIFNLRIANLQVVDKLEEAPQGIVERIWHVLLHSLTPDAWARLALFPLWAALVCMAVFLLSRVEMLRKSGFILAVCFVAVSLLAFGMGHARLGYDGKHREGIIFANNAYVKSEPLATGKDLFILHKGVKVALLGSLGDWHRIRFSANKVGWVAKGSLEVI